MSDVSVKGNRGRAAKPQIHLVEAQDAPERPAPRKPVAMKPVTMKPKNTRLLEELLNVAAPQPQVERPDVVVPPDVAPAEDKPAADRKAKPGRLPLGLLARMRLRHAAMLAGFLLLIALPTAVTSFYMAFVAVNQYHSAASFSIRSIESSQPSDILGIFSQASSGSTLSDSYVLLDFILSERMVKAVDAEFGLERVFAPRGMDFFFGISRNLPIEEKLDYWRRMVSINYDQASGIMKLEVRAFTPEDSQRIAGFIIAQGEKLVNELSLSARDEMLKASQREVRMAEERLSNARNALRIYREASQEADPMEGARLAAQLVASLEQKLVTLNTDLSTALTQMGENTPRIRLMRSQIASLERQIEQARQRFGGGSAGAKQGRNGSVMLGDVAGRIEQFETLETDREFAERAYTSVLTSLEKARMEVDGKQRYLATFIHPTMSELAQYPRRILDTVLVLLAGLLVWGVAVMGYYNIRDRN